MNVRFFTVFFTILISQFAFSQQKLEIALQKMLLQADYKNSLIGVELINAETGEQVFSYYGDKLLIPASTMKLISSAAALEILGENYRFTTKIGYSGKVKDQKVKGNLVIIGGGDPVLGSQYFQNEYFAKHFLDVWAQKIKAAGISQIDGDLILNAGLYDSEKIPPTWIWEDMGNYYGAGASALTVYDNLFRITFSSPEIAGKPTKIISMFPQMENLEIKNNVLSSDENRDLAYVFGSPLDKNREIRGTIPKNRKAFTIKAAVQHPEKILAEDFINHLAKNGVFLNGKVRFDKNDLSDFQTVYIQESPVLAEIVKVLNHESVNLFAEHLVKQIAAEKNGVGNREEGIKIVQEFWKSKGIDLFFMEDGSGLSHFNAVSPKQFTQILKYMFCESDYKEVFFNSLPGAGNGTLSGFSPQIFPENSLKAKSGSMTRVRCYSGYIQSNTGKNLAFSIMLNHFSGSHSKLISEIEKLLAEIKTLN